MTTAKQKPSKAASVKDAKAKAAATPIKRTTTRRRTTRATTSNVPVKRNTTTKPVATTANATKIVTRVVTSTSTASTKARKSKVEEKIKPLKVKMARDSFTMPKDEYAQLATLKSRLATLGQPAKKSELLRAGIKLLAAMTDARLKTVLAAVPVIKTGRPKKK